MQFPPTVVPTFDDLLNRVVKIVGVSDDLDSSPPARRRLRRSSERRSVRRGRNPITSM